MKELLKFVTCGSVDDGKSTLIGHMLYDAKLIFADQKKSLELDSKVGSRGGEIDYSLLLDGLIAEREQGITIDVAYRYFTTTKRSFIVADAPGHEQYTRNMAVAASFADVAVILVDACKGIQVQTRRHAGICSMIGITTFIFAVNKMDLVDYSKMVFDKIKMEITSLCKDLGIETFHCIPVSATQGDNVTESSGYMPYYQGEALLGCLENIQVKRDKKNKNFIMPVQRVCRCNADFRGFQGQIESGSIHLGEEIKILPGNESGKVVEILMGDKNVKAAFRGQPVTVRLNRETDVSRGSVFVKDCDLFVNSMFTTRLLWMDEDEMTEGKNYYIKVGTKMISARIMKVKYKVDVNTGENISAQTVHKNDIVECDICTSDKIVFESFEYAKVLGSFILIDRVSHHTAACGIIKHVLRRENNVLWQKIDVTREMRSKQKAQEPYTIWFTGLPGSGKSTLANELEKRFVTLGKHTMLLDGDNVRMGLNKNLGFTEKDRIENIRRVAEVAKILNDAGLIVITAFISPTVSERMEARRIIGDAFIEVYVSTPLEECERRDVKGLYKEARAGKIPNFTGVSSAYEASQYSEITIDNKGMTLEATSDYLFEELKKYVRCL